MVIGSFFMGYQMFVLFPLGKNRKNVSVRFITDKIPIFTFEEESAQL